MKMISTLIAIATSVTLLYFSSPSKSFYHSLFISDSLSSNESIANHLYILTKRPHVAGTQANADAATYVLSTLSSFNIKSHFANYQVALTYPVSRSLTLTRTPTDTPIKFDLRQDIYQGDPYADVANEVLPTFHAYAKSGTAVAPVVYANYGRVQDYAVLKEMKVNVSGNVILARYGKIYRGDIVNNAYAAGASGVLIFTDRKDYGGGGDAKWFPDDKWMPPSGVQVGSLFLGAGDPTTPGWPSSGVCERLSDDEVEKRGDVPLIPSLPISWGDGDTILRSIGGQVANADWQGGKDAPVYKVGPGPGIVNLSYTGKQVISTIQNVIGIIEGVEEPDRFVILGNHRDAWTFGAVDPNSGTAALLEVANRMRKLQKKGWKPRRTIIFCNWDAEEYGLIGSTEWVEENREMLASRAVAYMNVDVAVQGVGFYAYATPQLDELLIKATKQVQDPDNTSQSIYQSWIGSGENPTIGRLGGGGSDYASFLQHVGVPVTDMSFGGDYPVYHSLYDDFIWMKKFGDPMFHRHVAGVRGTTIDNHMVKNEFPFRSRIISSLVALHIQTVTSIWGLIALQLADEEFLPFNYLFYANELQRSAEALKNELSDKGIQLSPVFSSIKELRKAATKINNEIKVQQDRKTWASAWENDYHKVREVNDRLMMTERAFINREGLSGRPWYKHLIYAPSKHNDYGSKSFPGIDDAFEKAKSLNTTDSWQLVQHEVWRVSRVIKHASLVLRGELT